MLRLNNGFKIVPILFLPTVGPIVRNTMLDEYVAPWAIDDIVDRASISDSIDDWHVSASWERRREAPRSDEKM